MSEMLMESEDFNNLPLGKIPKDWEIKTLGAITSKIVDGTHFTPKYVEYGVPFLRVTDIQNSTINLDNVKRITVNEHRQLTVRCKPEYGDILYSKNGTVGITKTVDWHEEFSLFVSICLIKPITSLVNYKYLSKTLQSFLIENQIRIRSKQMTVSNLHLEEIREFLIPLPNLDEQQKIAEILDAIDKAIALTDTHIAKLKKAKAGLLHDLLTRGIDEHGELRDYTRNPELFKRSLLGIIPKDWELTKIGETALINSGTTPARDNHRYWQDGIISWIKTGEINYEIVQEAEEKITQKAFNETSLTICPVGTVLVAMYGQGVTRGRVGILGIEATINQACAGIIPNQESLLPKYLFYYLTYKYEQLRNIGHGSNQANLNEKLIANFSVTLPTVTEQIKLVNLLDSYDARIRLKRNYCEKLKILKKGLMSDLLTGRVRVKI